MKTATDRPQFVFGVLLVVLGGLFLLSNTGLLRDFSVWQTLWGLFWLWLGAVVLGYLPAALIAGGRRASWRYADREGGRGSGRLVLGLILLFIGAVTLVDGLGFIAFSVGDLIGSFWPLILIGIGILILTESRRSALRAAATEAPSAPSDRIEYDAIFGDFKLTQAGWRLRDVRASTIIGDMKIDLSKAHIPDGETTIDLRALISDIDVWAPPDVPVALDVQSILASVNQYGRKQDVAFRRHTDTPPDYDLAPRRVRLRVDLIFGDVNLIRAG